MGVDYSIRTYVKKEKIANCLNWLHDNSWSNSDAVNVNVNNEQLKIKGDHFMLNEYSGAALQRKDIVEEFDKL